VSPEDALEKLSQEYARIYNLAPLGRNLILATGEVQVKVIDRVGKKGGRNQHLTALLMSKFVFPIDFSFLAIASDGVDFLEGVHGAFYDSTMKEDVKINLQFIIKEIKNCNTYEVHKKLNTLVQGGVTGTNMSDFFLFSFEKT
jgi:glycerate-2-kinase